MKSNHTKSFALHFLTKLGIASHTLKLEILEEKVLKIGRRDELLNNDSLIMQDWKF